MSTFQQLTRPMWSTCLLSAALAPLTGCLDGSEPELCVREQALVAGQGTQLQGMHLNGMHLNGRDLNGIHLQGIYVTGRDLGSVKLPDVDLAGTELVGEASGAQLRGDDFVGAEIEAVSEAGARIPLTVTAVAAAVDDPELVYTTLEGPDGTNVCGPGGRGIFLEGVWDGRGARRDAFEADGDTIRVTYSCSDGVIAKCVRWGYRPWESGAELHQACTRMARADYCGDGVAHTENGTAIDVFDAADVQVPESTPADDFVFEAGWGPSGAVCVDRPRYRDVEPDGSERLPSCFRELPRCADWASARGHGAVVGNASVPQARLLCGE